MSDSDKYSELDRLLTMIIVLGSIILIFIYVYTPEEHVMDNKNNSTMAYYTNVSKLNKSTKSTDVLKIRSNSSIRALNISLATKEDKRLIDLAMEGNDVLRKDLTYVVDAANNEDHKSLATYGGYIKRDSQKYLNELNDLAVSPPFMILFEEFKQALENFYKAGKYIESGAINYGDLRISVTYLDEAFEHTNNTYILIGAKS